MYSLPSLGIGFVFAPGLEGLFEAGADMVDVVEIEPQTAWFRSQGAKSGYRLDPDFFNFVRSCPHRKIVHGVGFPIGATTALETDQIDAFTESIETVDAAWASEHLSFNRVGKGASTFQTGFLLPPIQSVESADVAAANIRVLKSQLPVSFAFETGVNYLRPRPGELTDGQFFREVAERADCGILLDLHNLWANELNGRQSVEEVLQEIPLERVWEIHLAGGEEYRGYWLDAHSGLIPEQLLEKASQVIPRLPNLKALIFEVISGFISHKKIDRYQFREQFQRMGELWGTRGSRVEKSLITQFRDEGGETLLSPARWEYELGSLASKCSYEGSDASSLHGDPGVSIYQHLVRTVRGGMVVSALKYTCRLLRLSLGETAFSRIVESHWRQSTPEPFAGDEATGFAEFLKRERLNIPHLYEVLDFELALLRAATTGRPQQVKFSCHPLSILNDLEHGRVVSYPTLDSFELTVRPNAIEICEKALHAS